MNRIKTKLWRRGLVGMLLILGLAGVLMFVLLQTETGCRFLANQVSARLSGGPQKVRLVDLRVMLPDRITVGTIAVSDATGLWLRVQGVDFRVNLSRLMSGYLEAKALQVTEFDMERIPVKEAKSQSQAVPSLPAFRVVSLTGDRIRLGASVCGVPVEISRLSGTVQGGNTVGGVEFGIKSSAARVALSTVEVARVEADLAVSVGASRWGMSRCEVSGEGVNIGGALDFPGAGGAPTGRMKVELDGTADWVRGVLPGVSFKTVMMQVASRPARNGGEGEIEALVRLQEASVGSLIVTGMEVRVSGPLHELAVEGTAGGLFQQPYMMTVAGQLKWGAGQWDIALQRASVEWAGVNVCLDEPSRILIDGGEVAVCGAFHSAPYDLGVISNVVVGGLAGRVSTQVRVRGTLAAPEFEGRINGEGLASSAYDYPGIQGVDGSCQFGYSNGVLNVVGEAAMATGHLARLKGSLPAQISFLPRRLTYDAARLLIDLQGKVGPVHEGSVHVRGGAIGVSGFWHALDLVATADGSVAGQIFNVDVGGGVKWTESMVDLELKRATIGVAGIQAKAVEPLRVKVGDGTNVLSAAWRAEVLDVYHVFGVATQAATGRMVADVKVRGSLAGPELEGRLVCEGLVAPWKGLSSLAAVSGEGGVSLSNGLVNAWMSMGFATGGVVKAAVQAPIELSLWPWGMRVDRDKNLMAGVEAGLDLSVLKGLDVFANGRLSGNIDLKVNHLGSLNNGSVTGHCVLANGEYENFEYGTVIRGATVSLIAQDEVLKVESGTAMVGGKGRLSLTGTVRLDPAKGMPYDLELTCQKARLVHRPDVEATLSGVLGLEGTLSSLRATGKMQLDEALVQLQNLRPTPPEALGGARPAAVPSVSGAVKDNTNIVLRLAVDIPGTLYVRGRTLDSVWAGTMLFDYTGGASGLSGYLEPRRGTILLLKRPFKLSEGRIEFNREWPPDPSLRLTAAYSRTDIQAKVNIVGKMGNPEITLTSEPAMPEDEILSRILFGKDMSTVTPLQALSLASEATKLKKIGGGTGVMGDVQEAVGIDRVEFREAGEGSGSPEVAAGKYLGDRSYVEMRRTTATAQPGQAQIYMEHELRPNIVLEAESGVEMRSGIGMFWKLDY